MKTATFIVLVCLLHYVKGRCICADKGGNKVSRKAIEKVEIIPPCPSCKRLEIVVTMRGAEQKCLNPGSRFTKYLTCNPKSRVQVSVPAGIVRPLSKAPNPQLLPGCRSKI
uniref:Chemokine interleukin-8-like domain-containing protein n=1 Tax=Cyprinus carpio TaxID=7962 RepID=A0A8C2IAA6_CYPCA